MTVSINPSNWLLYVPLAGTCYFLFLIRKFLWASRVVLMRIVIGAASVGCAGIWLDNKLCAPPTEKQIAAKEKETAAKDAAQIKARAAFEADLHRVLPGKWLALYVQLIEPNDYTTRCMIVKKFTSEIASKEPKLTVVGFRKIYDICGADLDNKVRDELHACLAPYIDLGITQDKS